MRDIEYVVELAKAYGRAKIIRDELQDEIHSCSLDTVMFGVNAFAEEFGDEDAPAFVVEAEIRIIWERAFIPAELGADPETSWLSEGCWSGRRTRERICRRNASSDNLDTRPIWLFQLFRAIQYHAITGPDRETRQ